MEKDLISVIVPVYNTGKYLEECIESIINQSYKNLEIIIVNDDSTDESEDIILKYQSIDKRIRYYHKEKSGSGLTRNFGIQEALGKFISFIDSDDYIDLEMIEKLYLSIKEDDSFAAVTKGYEVINGENILFARTKEETKLLRSPSVCMKLFNKKIIDESGIRFTNVIIGEDLEFVFKLLIYNDKISYVDEPLYYYRIHPNSTTRTSNKALFSVFTAISSIEEYARKMEKFNAYYKRLEYATVYHALCGTIKRIVYFPDYKTESIIKSLDYVNEKFPNWQNNEYVNSFLVKELNFVKEILDKHQISNIVNQ